MAQKAYKLKASKSVLLIVLILSVFICDSYQSQGQSFRPYLILHALDIEGQVLLEKMSVRNDHKILGRTVSIGKIAEKTLPFQKIMERTPKLLMGGVGVSGNAFIDNIEKRVWLNENFNALITDRESAAVAQVCTVNDVPFIIFRSASDLAGGSGPSSARSELRKFSRVASINSSILVIKLLENL